MRKPKPSSQRYLRGIFNHRRGAGRILVQNVNESLRRVFVHRVGSSDDPWANVVQLNGACAPCVDEWVVTEPGTDGAFPLAPVQAERIDLTSRHHLLVRYRVSEDVLTVGEGIVALRPNYFLAIQIQSSNAPKGVTLRDDRPGVLNMAHNGDYLVQKYDHQYHYAYGTFVIVPAATWVDYKPVPMSDGVVVKPGRLTYPGPGCFENGMC